MAKYVPKGMIVPLATPFHKDESINFEAYKKLIDHVIEGGIHGILAGGSTGEYHMMSLDERKAVIKAACEYAAGRVPVVAGVGRYTAKDTIELANYAADCGASCGMVLPPYYQQTSREGVVEFFREVAEGSKIGIMMYNNPLATGVDMAPDLICEIAQLPNIVCLKDSADMIHTAQCIALTRDIPDFTVLNGAEHLIIPTIASGGHGAMGIIYNLIPKEVVKIYDLLMANDWKGAAAQNAKLTALYDTMEVEPYPGPVKAGLEMLGIEAGPVRKPLTQTSDALRQVIRAELKKIGYNV